jgi:SAM-dependent MidA family methyltransferase
MTTLPDAPLGIIANELFDAIPVRPLIKHEGLWHEDALIGGDCDTLRMIGLPVNVDKGILPFGHENQPDGTVFEYAPAREAVLATIAERLAKSSGFGLFIDYGHLRSGFGDTVQAMKSHAYANPLENPGEADLTSHVDFEALAGAAKSAGLIVPSMMTQGDFLARLGIRERTERLAMLQPAQSNTIETACERLIGDDQMGRLFKVMAIGTPGIALPAFD